jgi:hypothetical protein
MNHGFYDCASMVRGHCAGSRSVSGRCGKPDRAVFNCADDNGRRANRAMFSATCWTFPYPRQCDPILRAHICETEIHDAPSLEHGSVPLGAAIEQALQQDDAPGRARNAAIMLDSLQR